MIHKDVTSVSAAFDMVLEEIETEIDFIVAHSIKCCADSIPGEDDE